MPHERPGRRPRTGGFLLAAGLALSAPGVPQIAVADVGNSPAADTCSNILYGGASGGIAPTILYELNPATGAVTRPIGSTGFVNVGAIAIHPVTGTMYGVWADGELIRIDRTTGAGTLIGSMENTSTNFGLMDLTFRRSDNALFLLALPQSAAEVAFGLFNPNLATGYARMVGPTGSYGGGNGLAFDAQDVLYHAVGGKGSNPGTLNTVNASTGRSTPLRPLIYQGFPSEGSPGRINAMDFHPVTQGLYVSANFGSDGGGNTYLATLNPLTGIVTHLGLSTGSLEALAWGNDCGDGDPCTIDRCEPGAAGLQCTHVAAPDADFDGLCDAIENCPDDANPGQEDADADGTGDACDSCPMIYNPGQEDRDGDLIEDVCDLCPFDASNHDTDGDGLCDDGDGSGLPGDGPCTITRLAGMPCDDNCPDRSNPAQTDTDLDGLGDVCDACTDLDGDGFGDPGFPRDTCSVDNCRNDGSRLSNGGFETGTLSPSWTRSVFPSCCGNWVINTVGTPVYGYSYLGLTTANPRGGRYHAYSGTMDNSSPLTMALSQSFSVPPTATRVRVFFQMFVNNYSGASVVVNPAGLDHTHGANHHGRADLLLAGSPTYDTGAGVVRNLYLGADPGPLPNPYRDYEFDVTGNVTPGASYTMRFAITTTSPPLNMGVDNVRVVVDLGQPDADGDAIGDLCDCGPVDAAAGRPPAIGDLMAGDTGLWTWSPVPAADQYEVTRGLLSSLDLGKYGTCLATIGAPPLPIDADMPPPGDGFLYLVQGKDLACGGLGSLGYSYLGDRPGAPTSAERVNTDPLACP